MRERIAEEQQRQRSDDRQVPPIAAGDNLPGDDNHEEDGKGEIDNGRDARADQARKQNRQPSEKPYGHKRGQRRALQGQTSGPVRDRREKESGHNRAAIAEGQFVNVPQARGKNRWRGRRAGYDGDGGWDHEESPKRRGQEEGAKPGGQRRWAGISAITGNRSHERPLVPELPGRAPLLIQRDRARLYLVEAADQKSVIEPLSLLLRASAAKLIGFGPSSDLKPISRSYRNAD